VTTAAMDERSRGGYLRAVQLQRPSRNVVLATALGSVVLAAGGFWLGSRSDDPAVPAAVPFAPAKPAAGGDPIVVPDRVDPPSP